MTTDDPVVVVIGRDGARVGELVADLQGDGHRAAAFVGDPATERDALVEMLAELFGERSSSD
jgi:hypothetical protein